MDSRIDKRPDRLLKSDNIGVVSDQSCCIVFVSDYFYHIYSPDTFSPFVEPIEVWYYFFFVWDCYIQTFKVWIVADNISKLRDIFNLKIEVLCINSLLFEFLGKEFLGK